MRQHWIRSILAGLACLAASNAAPAAVDLWPLYQQDDEGTTVLYPLYVHEDEFLMVAPFYVRTNQAKDHHVLWPLVKVSEGRVTRVAPFYFSDHEATFTLFPLLHQSPSGTFWMLPPTYFSRTEDFSAVLPFYAHDGERTWTLPNLYFEREAGELVRFMSYLVFDWEREGAEQQLRMLGIAGGRWGDDQTRAWLLPLFHVTRERDASATLLGPYYRATGPNRDARAFLPLYGDFRHDGRRTFWLGSYYDHEDGRGWRRGLLPFYTASAEHHPATGNREHALSLLGWLYSREVTANAAGERIAHRRRFLVFTDSLDERGRRTLGLFGLPIWERTR